MSEGQTPRPGDDAPPVPPLDEGGEAEDPEPDSSDLLGHLVDEVPGAELLDDSSGEKDEIENLEDELGAEDGWTEGSDAEESAEDLDEAEDGEEDGWTEGSEATGTEDWDEDLLPPLDSEGTEPDSGDEGTEEVEISDEVDMEIVPLEEHGDDDEGEEPDLLEGAPSEDAPWSIPPALDPSLVLVRHLGPRDVAVGSVASLGGAVWAAGGDLFAGNSERIARIEDAVLEGAEAQSVALVAGSDGPIVFVGTALAGCLVRRAPDSPFVPANRWSRGRTHTAFEVTGGGRHVLGRCGDGHAYRTEDAGETWRRLDVGGRCLAVAGDGSRVVALVTAARKPPFIASSDDGGEQFELLPLDLPEGAQLGADISLSVVGNRVLVAAEELSAPIFSRDGGRSFVQWTCPGANAGALDPQVPGKAYLSLFHAAEDEGALVMTTDDGESFVTLFELRQLRRVFRLEERVDQEGDNRIGAVFADRDTRGRVFVASAAGAFVAAIR